MPSISAMPPKSRLIPLRILRMPTFGTTSFGNPPSTILSSGKTAFSCVAKSYLFPDSSGSLGSVSIYNSSLMPE